MLIASVNKAWRNASILGIGVGWCKEDKTACLILLLFGWMVILGPHVRPNVGNNLRAPGTGERQVD